MRTSEEAVRDYLRARETGDLALLDEVVAPGFTHRMRGVQEDRDTLFARVAQAASLYADMHHEIEVLLTTGVQVVCQYRFRARHVEPLPLSGSLADLCGATQIPAAGGTVEMTGMFIAVVRDGQLQSGAGEFDALGLLLQLRAQGRPDPGRPADG